MRAFRAFAVALILLALCIGCKKKPSTRPYPLHWAVQHADRTEVISLLSAGADVNSRDADGLDPLHYAVMSGDAGMIDLLISRGADVDANSPYGDTPLHCAAMGGHAAAARRLIDAGARIDTKGSWRHATPLQAAFLCRSMKVAELLVSAGADPDVRDEWGRTMLHNAALNGQMDFAELFAVKGAPLSAKDNEGLTPLHEAAWEDRREIAELLLARGAEVSARDFAGETPLHVAAINGHAELFDLLVARGADVRAKDGQGLTPLDYVHSPGIQQMTVVSMESKGPYSVIITNPNEVRKFLRMCSISYDRVWVPDRADIDGLDQALKSSLESGPPVSKDVWFDREYVQGHLGEYCKEFSGFMKHGMKYVICGMVLSDDPRPAPPGNTFSQMQIADGGCGIVRVIFKADARSVVKIECNGN